jgi:hypothetical protein
MPRSPYSLLRPDPGTLLAMQFVELALQRFGPLHLANLMDAINQDLARIPKSTIRCAFWRMVDLGILSLETDRTISLREAT